MVLRTKSLVFCMTALLFMWSGPSVSNDYSNRININQFDQFTGEILTQGGLSFIDGFIWSLKLLSNHPDIEEIVPGYAYYGNNFPDDADLAPLIIRWQDLPDNTNSEFIESVASEVLPLLPQDSSDGIIISIGSPLPDVEPDAVFWSRCRSDAIHKAGTLCYDTLAASPFTQHKRISNYSRLNSERETN